MTYQSLYFYFIETLTDDMCGTFFDFLIFSETGTYCSSFYALLQSMDNIQETGTWTGRSPRII